VWRRQWGVTGKFGDHDHGLTDIWPPLLFTTMSMRRRSGHSLSDEGPNVATWIPLSKPLHQLGFDAPSIDDSEPRSDHAALWPEFQLSNQFTTAKITFGGLPFHSPSLVAGAGRVGYRVRFFHTLSVSLDSLSCALIAQSLTSQF